MRMPSFFRTAADHTGSYPTRSPEDCMLCGLCENECPESAICLGPTGPRIDLAACTACGMCIATCTTGTLVAAPQEAAL